MPTPLPSSQNPSGRLEAQARNLLARFSPEERDQLAVLFSTSYEASRLRNVSDLWECTEAPWTYWILLMSSPDQPDERRIAKELLDWQAFSAKTACKVMCIPSSEHNAFQICSREFQSNEFPTLIMGVSPAMESYIRLNPTLLARLSSSEGALYRFFTSLHWKIRHGESLSGIRDHLTKKAFWEGLKLVYEEVKGLFSFSINTGG